MSNVGAANLPEARKGIKQGRPLNSLNGKYPLKNDSRFRQCRLTPYALCTGEIPIIREPEAQKAIHSPLSQAACSMDNWLVESDRSPIS